MSLLPEGIRPDYHKTEPGCAWFTIATAAGLVLADRKSDLPKRTGLDPERVQVGAFRFRKWGLADDLGRFMPAALLRHHDSNPNPNPNQPPTPNQ